MSLMEKFANPEMFETLSMGDKILGSVITALMGMGITFLVLILLWIVIAIMSRALGTSGKPKEVSPSVAAPAPAAPAPAVTVDKSVNADAELVAVITAAIAAYEGASSQMSSNLIVRKINRISGTSLPWSAAGRSECISSRNIG